MEDLERLPRGRDVLWSGDFNAHHPSWDENSEEDALGEALVEMMADYSLASLNDGKGTWYARLGSAKLPVRLTSLMRRQQRRVAQPGQGSRISPRITSLYWWNGGNPIRRRPERRKLCPTYRRWIGMSKQRCWTESWRCQVRRAPLKSDMNNWLML